MPLFFFKEGEEGGKTVFVDIGKRAVRVIHQKVRILKGRFYEKEERIIKCNGPLMYFEI